METIVRPPELQVDLPLDRLAELCRQKKIVRLEVFGSALRDDFRAGSDVDLLVTYSDDAHWGLFGHARIAHEFSELLGRPVDLVSRRGVERSSNWIRKTEILSTAREIYAA